MRKKKIKIEDYEDYEDYDTTDQESLLKNIEEYMESRLLKSDRL